MASPMSAIGYAPQRPALGLLEVRGQLRPRFWSARATAAVQRRAWDATPVASFSLQALSAAKRRLELLGLWKGSLVSTLAPGSVPVLSLVLLLLMRAGAAKALLRAFRSCQGWLEHAQDAIGTAIIMNVSDGQYDADDGLGDEEDRNALEKLVLSAEQPIIIGLLASTVLHFVLLLSPLLAGFIQVAPFIRWVHVANRINLTVSCAWLAVRFLDTRLALLKSRPSLLGDLSNIKRAASFASTRYARDAAVTNLAQVGIVTLAAVLCLRHAGISLSRVLAVTGISGIVSALLLGDVLANLFDGGLIKITQPFVEGDTIISDTNKIDGWVQKVGWYYTCLQRWDNRPQYIPNSTFSRIAVVNGTRMTHRRILLELHLRVSDLARVEEMLTEMRQLVEHHDGLDERMHRVCRLRKVDMYSLKIWVSCYTGPVGLAEYLEVQENLLLGLSSILTSYNTTWASHMERIYPPEGGEEAENQYRRLLYIRSRLRQQEKAMEQRLELLRIEQTTFADAERALQDQQRMLVEEEAGLGQRGALVLTKTATRRGRELALKAQRSALQQRYQAIAMLEQSMEYVNDEEEAERIREEAMRLRERSILKRQRAVVIERGALESEKEALQKEMELLQQSRRDRDDRDSQNEFSEQSST